MGLLKNKPELGPAGPRNGIGAAVDEKADRRVTLGLTLYEAIRDIVAELRDEEDQTDDPKNLS